MITTNYDCGLEQAWRQVRGIQPGEWAPVAHQGDLGGARGRKGEPCLRLYKINGCAARLKASSEEEREARAQEIQLTDLQLQQFGRERRWAQRIFESLFQDRQVVLTGFGSDEAQVWFVVMEILGGLRDKPEGRYLWVAEHSNLIGFHLLQALVGENRVRRRKWMPFDNVFSKQDCGFFNGKDAGLDAGDFWRRAWIDALSRGLSDIEGRAVEEFVRAYNGRGFQKGRPEDVQAAGVWKTAVQTVFEGGIPWLDEPMRADGTSRWSKHDKTLPECDAPCAPGLACLYLEDGKTVYRAPSEAPEYWIAMILALLALPGDHINMKGARVDHQPALDITFGENGRRITRIGRRLDLQPGPTVDRHSSRETVVGNMIPIDLLQHLGNWDHNTGVDGLRDTVRQRVHYGLQPAREYEARLRHDRRIPDEVEA